MKKLNLLSLATVGAGLALLPQGAFAHAGHEHEVVGNAFASGLFHPWMGLDHLVAMVAVGIWATQLGKRSVWMMPLAFVSMMVMGAVLSFNRLTVPFAEAGIAASVFVLGLLIAFQAKVPAKAGMAIVGAFAIFHGAAHGSELTTGANSAVYTLGFVASTMALHAAGIGGAALLASLKQRPLVRVSGAMMVMFAGMLAWGLLSKGTV